MNQSCNDCDVLFNINSIPCDKCNENICKEILKGKGVLKWNLTVIQVK